MNKTLSVLVKVFISLIALYLLLNLIDVRGLMAAITSISMSALVIALSLFLAQLSLLSLRLSLVTNFDGNGIGLMRAAYITLIGNAANQVMPSAVGGDAIKLLALSRLGVAVRVAAQKVAIDRIAGLISLAGTVLLTFPFALGSLPEDLPVGPILLAVGLLIAGVVAGVGVTFIISRRPQALRSGLISKLLDVVQMIWTGIRTLLKRPPIAAAIIAIGCLQCTLYSLMFFVLARGVGIEVDVLFILFILPVAFIFTMVPISIAGWGIRESVLAAALTLVGVAPSDTVAASLIFGCIPLLYGLLSLPLVISEARRLPEPPPEMSE
ncbi:lysylphosphatidylglycerol synthase transmembrane domain-containing protein [Henriciella marina]|uniref:lysylphosphatidylglycerol synthase transmembrane domain-containing protein n=1 Tax=Henriciella marina TaxID=453851 RepID=UPI00036B73DE|nr:lysylphosphatidylglycerol synthase transmembrane domain-containing protein [Henriciella marina]